MTLDRHLIIRLATVRADAVEDVLGLVQGRNLGWEVTHPSKCETPLLAGQSKILQGKDILLVLGVKDFDWVVPPCNPPPPQRKGPLSRWFLNLD